MASLLVSSSRFSDTAWKWAAIKHSKTLLCGIDDCYLQSLATHRESVLLRMYGDRSASSEIIEAFIHSTVLPNHDNRLELGACWNAQCGDLVVSLAENLIQDGEISKARLALEPWQPLNPNKPTFMESLVWGARGAALGKILRLDGKLTEALEVFEGLRQEDGDGRLYLKVLWRNVLCTLLRAQPADSSRGTPTTRN